MREGVREIAGDRQVTRPGEQERRVGVLQDGGELGLAEPPVQRHRHRSDLGDREQQLHDLGGGAVEVCDTRAGPDARGEQALGQAIGALVELREGQRARAVPDRDDVSALARLVTQNVRDAELFSQHEVNSITPPKAARAQRGQACPAKKAAISSSTWGSSVA